jgi:hypothetical protein
MINYHECGVIYLGLMVRDQKKNFYLEARYT